MAVQKKPILGMLAEPRLPCSKLKEYEGTFTIAILLFYKSVKLPLKMTSWCKGGVRPLAGIHLVTLKPIIPDQLSLPKPGSRTQNRPGPLQAADSC